MNLREIIREALEQQLDKTLVLKENVEVSDALKYHIDNGMSLTDNVFRVYSESYFDLVNEVRDLYNEGIIGLNEEDRLMIESDLGKKIKIGKEIVYLDAPYIYETETEEDILAEAKHQEKMLPLVNHSEHQVVLKNSQFMLEVEVVVLRKLLLVTQV